MVIVLHRKASARLALVHMESLSHQNESALWTDAAMLGGQHECKLISAPAVPVWAHTVCPEPFYPVPASPGGSSMSSVTKIWGNCHLPSVTSLAEYRSFSLELLLPGGPQLPCKPCSANDHRGLVCLGKAGPPHFMILCKGAPQASLFLKD